MVSLLLTLVSFRESNSSECKLTSAGILWWKNVLFSFRTVLLAINSEELFQNVPCPLFLSGSE